MCPLNCGDCLFWSQHNIVVLLVFYGPSTHFRSFRARSVKPVHTSWAILLGNCPVLCAHSFASNWQRPFLNQRKRENGCRNYFVTKLHKRILPDVRIEPATVRIPGGHASDQAITPGANTVEKTIVNENRFMSITYPHLPSGLFHPYQLVEPISNFRGVWCTFSFLFYLEYIFLLAYSEDPDQTLRSAASDLGLHCLSMSLKWDP